MSDKVKHELDKLHKKAHEIIEKFGGISLIPHTNEYWKIMNEIRAIERGDK